jgi:hypothetical protein
MGQPQGLPLQTVRAVLKRGSLGALVEMPPFEHEMPKVHSQFLGEI